MKRLRHALQSAENPGSNDIQTCEFDIKRYLLINLLNIIKIKSYIRDNFDGCKVIALVAGNIRDQQAIQAVKNFIRKMKINGPFSDSHRYSSTRSVQFPPGSNFLVQTRAKYSPENAVMVTYQVSCFLFVTLVVYTMGCERFGISRRPVHAPLSILLTIFYG